MRHATPFADEALGSPLRLLVIAPTATAEAAWGAVRVEMAAVDAALSRHREDSELILLNHASPGCIPVGGRLRHALALAWRAYRSSLGRFDPRIIGALEAAGDRAGVPLPSSPARLRPEERWLRADRHRRGVLAPVDLGGIGKGLALRWSAERIRRLGVRDFLLEAGGDIVAAGSAPGGGWRVSLAGPDGQRPLAVLELPVASVALATSAQTRRRHIIDPATLRPVDGPARQATVAGADPAWAEVRSKLAILAGTPAGTERAWWYGADGRLRATASAREWVAWEALSPSASSAAC
ncbi:MAG TPA: FAD:protein FMN transferase [Candidatus Limnocylindria bacterium]|nr:FAD:protein FMN transferase [Candidatus Limnocylindria bacterium]